MLFKVLFAIIVIYLLFIPLITVELIKFGIRIATKVQKMECDTREFDGLFDEMEEESKPILDKLAEDKAEKRKKKSRRAKLDEVSEHYMKIMRNIDNYDGTGYGQEEIK